LQQATSNKIYEKYLEEVFSIEKLMTELSGVNNYNSISAKELSKTSTAIKSKTENFNKKLQ
jgi:septin family protein